MRIYTTEKLSENMHETPEGYLLCVGVSIARTGEYTYGAGETPLEAGPDNRVIISRNPEEVFRPETLASFEAKPVTIFHPNEFVDVDNWTSLTKGLIQNVRRGTGAQENDLIADILITDSQAIQLVRNGLREVSCGYEAEYVQTGIGRGIQRNIIGNHLALVDAGRAGSAYAINDRKGSDMKWKDKVAGIFAKAQDEALKVVQEESKETPAPEPKVEDKGKKKATIDSLIARVNDLMVDLGAMQKDMESAPSQSEPAEMKDAVEERFKKIEDAIASLMEKMGAKDAKEDEEKEKSEDADEDKDDEKKAKDAKEESEESEDEYGDDVVTDEAFEEEMTADTKSRIEILAPGLKAEGKDAKSKALKAAYETKDGKKIIEQFTGGKTPDFGNEAFVSSVFVGASEVLKVARAQSLAQTRVFDLDSLAPQGAMTAEDLNKKNEKFYAGK